MSTKNFQLKLLALQDNLYHFAYRLTSNRDDACDLLQDTTLKALDNEEKYAENVNFKGWIFTIMRNIFINNYRKSVKLGITGDSSEDQYLLNSAGAPDSDTPECSYAVMEISSIIDSFPAGYREPFSLMVAGYKYAEIAEKLGLPVGTVKSRIYFARQRLQKRLGDYNG